MEEPNKICHWPKGFGWEVTGLNVDCELGDDIKWIR